MGKIEEALRRAKAASKPAGRPSLPTASIASDLQAERASVRPPSGLLSIAKPVELDPDILTRHRVIADAQQTNSASSYKMLRTRMLQRLRSSDWSRIAVTSARRNAGKTLTAVNTAISLAREPNQQVMLVDLDLRRPALGEYLGIHHPFGISDFLRGKATVEQILVRPNIDRLLVVPNNDSFDNSSEMLSSQRMVEFVRLISEPVNASIVLFDLPPLLEADDFLAFSSQIDALLLVVCEGETRRADLQQALDLTRDMNLLGLVLNKSREDDHPTGYYY